MFVKGKDAVSVQAEPGVTRKVLAYNESLMMCEITFEKGAQGAMHSHPHSQVTYVKAGNLRFTLGEDVFDIAKGDSVLIPPYETHGVTAEEASVLIDVFTPARMSFVAPPDK